MVEIGRSRDMKVAALLTSMDVPLGRAVGNAIEVAEAVDVLAGGGPTDLVEVTVALAEVMLELAGLTGDPRRALQDGSALASWRAMVRAQGGDPDAPLPVRDRGRAGAGGARRVTSAASRRAPSASPPGASVPAGPARRIP